jgi:hypothetical protein
VISQFPHALHYSVEGRAEPARSPSREQQPDTDAERQDAKHLRQLAIVNESRATGSDLERTNRGHASATTATQAGRLRTSFSVVRLVARGLLASSSRPTSAAYAGSKPKGDLRHRNHGHVTVPNGLMVDVANAEVSLEELGDRLDRGGSG